MRVVIDTSVIVAGLRSQKGASWSVLEHADRALFVMAASPALFLEYEQVLKRSDHRLAPEMVDGFLSELASKIEPVQVRFIWRPQLTDPDDEMVLEAAINGQVDGIVTHNRRDFMAAAGRFGMRVWSPGEFLQRLRREKVK
ncbi:MAG TPA: putative toxin-antitoxin system toxin component, PIN family [Terracidiphilus sp.]|nr:putative toxin-antitoxin system toxin component, PIN family [Terracidiphilus sp.]